MVKASKEVLVEICNEHCRNVYFAPLDRVVRGSFDVQKVARNNANAVSLLNSFPQAIPGQRIRLDMEHAEGSIEEPLHHEQHRATVEQLKKRNLRLCPERETFDSVDVASWLYHMRTAVNSGAAKVLEGEFPVGKIEGARESFVTQPAQDPIDRLTKAIESQTAAFERMLQR